MNGSDNPAGREKQEALKTIVRELHAGVPADKLRRQFAAVIKDASPEEIADMENALIAEGFPVEEVQRLCDVHVQVFDKALKKAGITGKIPGHPIFTYTEENAEAIKILKELKKLVKPLGKGAPEKGDVEAFQSTFGRFREIEKHFARKENQLFPALEAKGFTGPTKVMWGKHDEIREMIKGVEAAFKAKDWPGVASRQEKVSDAVKELVGLEEKILYPTSASKLTPADWARIKNGEPAIGYAWVKPSNLWDAELAEAMTEAESGAGAAEEVAAKPAPARLSSGVHLSTGRLTPEQVDLMLKALPLDITFVDENDRVAYYSDKPDRVFPRSPGIIGRAVQNCHPVKSVHVVNDIVKAFKEKTKDVAEFWIHLDGKFIYIRYYPVFDAAGVYRGVIEVTQEISGIQELKGDRRLLDW